MPLHYIHSGLIVSNIDFVCLVKMKPFIIPSSGCHNCDSFKCCNRIYGEHKNTWQSDWGGKNYEDIRKLCIKMFSALQWMNLNFTLEFFWMAHCYPTIMWILPVECSHNSRRHNNYNFRSIVHASTHRFSFRCSVVAARNKTPDPNSSWEAKQEEGIYYDAYLELNSNRKWE